MLTPEDHRKLHMLGKGTEMGELSALVRTGALSVEGAESYVAGRIEGAREFATAIIGEQATYNLLQAEADRTSAHRRVQIGTEQ